MNYWVKDKRQEMTLVLDIQKERRRIQMWNQKEMRKSTKKSEIVTEIWATHKIWEDLFLYAPTVKDKDT